MNKNKNKNDSKNKNKKTSFYLFNFSLATNELKLFDISSPGIKIEKTLPNRNYLKMKSNTHRSRGEKFSGAIIQKTKSITSKNSFSIFCR